MNAMDLRGLSLDAAVVDEVMQLDEEIGRQLVDRYLAEAARLARPLLEGDGTGAPLGLGPMLERGGAAVSTRAPLGLRPVLEQGRAPFDVQVCARRPPDPWGTAAGPPSPRREPNTVQRLQRLLGAPVELDDRVPPTVAIVGAMARTLDDSARCYPPKRPPRAWFEDAREAWLEAWHASAPTSRVIITSVDE